MISIRSIRLSLRFIVPLVVALTLLAYAVVPLVEKLTLHWFVRDMDIRSRLIANTLNDPLADLLQQGNKAKINAMLFRTIQDERLLALGYCDNDGKLLYRTPTFPESLGCSLAVSNNKMAASPLSQLPQGAVHIAIHPMETEGVRSGDALILVHDMSFVERRSADTRKYIIMLFALLGVVTSVITVFVAHLSWRGWMGYVRCCAARVFSNRFPSQR